MQIKKLTEIISYTRKFKTFNKNSIRRDRLSQRTKLENNEENFPPSCQDYEDSAAISSRNEVGICWNNVVWRPSVKIIFKPKMISNFSLTCNLAFLSWILNPRLYAHPRWLAINLDHMYRYQTWFRFVRLSIWLIVKEWLMCF